MIRRPWPFPIGNMIALRRSAAAIAVVLSSMLFAPAGEAADSRRKVRAESRSNEAAQGQRPVHVGVIGGIGFPRPLAIEGLVDVQRTIVLGVEYGSLPKTTIEGVDHSLSALSGDARLFPLRGAFFVGIRGGFQHIGASTTLSVAGESPVTKSITVDTWFLNPRVGFLWRWPPGLAVGFEAGIQIPFASTLTVPAPTGAPAAARATSIADSLGRSVLPTIDLLRVGLML